ncbi:hypothetical protein [Micromonospora cathayae]|uniref:Uncharacterized protein n=1 Tax=Micromonospora cathayae TaxID=3028804 RepID=A0ABY7ZVY4_9ACTN|nr:hypothetical protein [Micromonospora sp. HUAS 3]WDZ87075.1 hypothetical protein PVK37_12045 [Micromonospora sp. HUAS 3]
MFSLAAVVLIVGVTLQLRGLQDAANVAQLVSVVLAVPPLVVPLVVWLRTSRSEQRNLRGSGPEAPATDETSPLRVAAEVKDVEELARRDDGRLLPISGHSLRIIVESTDGTVVLKGLRPVVVSRDRVDATRIPKPTLGIVEPRRFTMHLDADPPRVHPQRAGVDFPFSVSPSDPEVIDVTVELRRDQVSWYLLLDWTRHGRSGTYRIMAAGQPFRTIGRNGLREVIR